LLTRFISKKGRPFKAYLTKTPSGSVGFEFEARAPRKGQAEAANEANSQQPQRGKRATVAKGEARSETPRKAPAKRRKTA